MQKIRAKFRVASVKDTGEGEQKRQEVDAFAVTGESGENADFAKATPSGIFNLNIDNPEAQGFFKEGDEFYITISKKPLEEAEPEKQGEKPKIDDNGGMFAKKTVHGPREALKGGITPFEGVTSAPPPNTLSAEMAAKGGAPAPGNAAHPDNLRAAEAREGKEVDPTAPRKEIDPKDASTKGGVIPDAPPGGAPAPSAAPAGGGLDSEPSTGPKPPASGGTNTAADDAPKQ